MSNIAFTRTRQNTSRPPFLVDKDAIVLDTGHQIAWEYLDERYTPGSLEIEVTANADIDDVALAVAALPRAVYAGEILNFGIKPAVTITLSGAEAIGQTAIGITALSAPLRAGTILKSGAGEFMQLTADANTGDTSLTVEALEVAWESADTATAPAERIFARVTADALAGATSLTVEALDNPIDDGEIAFVAGAGNMEAGFQVKPGTVMAKLADGRMVPRAVRPAAETAFALTSTYANQFSDTDAATGYGVIKSAAVYENLLPEADGADPSVIPSGYKTELLAAGGFWMFEQYSDDTV